MSYRLTARASADIDRIARYIARHNPSAAQHWLLDIRQLCARLGEMPAMGAARPDIRSDLRMFPEGNYLILYREIRSGAEIVRVLHGAREWQKLL